MQGVRIFEADSRGFLVSITQAPKAASATAPGC
jgi:hypothetical protein